MNGKRGNLNVKKTIIIIILLSIFFVFLTPFVLELVVFRSNMHSALTNGEWGGFLGSYIGGTFGGIGTLLAVYVTTKETRKVQKDTSKQIEDERKLTAKKHRKLFADEIAVKIAKYIAEIGVYHYGCRALDRLEKNLESEKEVLHDIEKNIRFCYNLEKQMGHNLDTVDKIEKLKQQEESQRYKIMNIEKEIDKHKVNRIIANECYFFLKIKLQNIDEGKEIMTKLEHIHENSADVKNTSLEWLDIETEMLAEMTVHFITDYVEQIQT